MIASEKRKRGRRENAGREHGESEGVFGGGGSRL